MNNQLLVFLPALHLELATAALPEFASDEIFFMGTGLGIPGDTGNVRRYLSPHLVYSAKQAKACLDDLLSFQANAGEFVSAAARQMADSFWGTLTPLESDDLKSFVQSGGKPGQAQVNEAKLRREIYEQAQKNLLLAWSQEENILDIRELLIKLGQSREALAENIGEPDLLEGALSGSTGGQHCPEENSAEPSGQASIKGMVDLIMQESGLESNDLRVQWAAALTGTLCLTPPTACFFTVRQDLERLLDEINPDGQNRPRIEPLSPELAECWKFTSGAAALKFVQCKIPGSLLLSAFASPLLKRLFLLDGDLRREATFILEHTGI